MSRAYVTELVGETPKVIVISDTSQSLGVLESTLDEAGLKTIVLTSAEAVSPPNLPLLKAAYRIVWLCPLWQVSEIATIGQKTQLVSLLQQFPDQVMLVVTQDTSLAHFSHPPHDATWHQLTVAQQKFLVWIAQYLKNPILRYFDVWTATEGREVSVIFEYLVAERSHLQLLDPQVTFAPQTWHAMMQDLAHRIMSPKVVSQAVLGKKSTTTAVAKLLVLHLQRLGSPLFSIKTQESSLASLVRGNSTTTFFVESLDQILGSLTSNLKMMAVQASHSPAASSADPLGVAHSPVVSSMPLPQANAPRPAPITAAPTKPVIAPTPLELEERRAVNIPPRSAIKITPYHAEAHAVVKPKPSFSVAKPVSSVMAPALGVAPEVRIAPAPVVTPTPAPVPVIAPEPVVAAPDLAPAPTATPAPTPTPPPVTSPPPAKIKAESEAQLESDLTYLFQKYRSLQKTEQVKGIVTDTKVTTKKSLRKRKTFWGGLIMIGVVLGAAALFGMYWLGNLSLKHQVLSSVKVAAASEIPEPSATRFMPWLGLMKAQNSLYTKVLPAEYTQDAVQTVTLAQLWLDLSQDLDELEPASTNLFLAMTNRYPVGVAEQLKKVTDLTQSAFQDISAIQVGLQAFQASEADAEVIEEALTSLNGHKRTLAGIQQIQPILGKLIGLEAKKTYAVVFQNDQELRPQGGLIQAVAFITLDQGMVTDTRVMSAAEIQATMLGTAQAPPEIKKYLGGESWAFRDSNWSADGVVAGKQVAVFIEAATNYNLDGVIFINSLMLQDWLKAIGPLELPEFNEEITDRNLADRLEAHSELQVDPTKTSDYASALLEAVVQKTLQTPETKIPLLLKAWGDNLNNKQMVMTLTQPAELETISALGWTGALVTPPCPTQFQQENCVVDTFAAVEANVGVNKANAYITRTASHQVTIEADQINHLHSMKLTNKAPSNSWPRGTYKAYIRLYLPLNALSPLPQINGVDVPQNAYDYFVEDGRQVVGLYVEVPIQEQAQVDLAYSLPYQKADDFSYALFTQFQPGIAPPTYQVSISAPQHQPQLIAPQAEVTATGVVFSPSSTLNSLVGIKFE